MKKKNHGGKRPGSGRPKKEPTKVIRIPKSWSKKDFIVYNDDASIFVKAKFK